MTTAPDPIQTIETQLEVADNTAISELEAIDPAAPKASHDEIAVRAYELWEETITSGGVDFGPWFYWFEAQFDLGVGPEPLPPPVE